MVTGLLDTQWLAQQDDTVEGDVIINPSCNLPGKKKFFFIIVGRDDCSSSKEQAIFLSWTNY